MIACQRAMVAQYQKKIKFIGNGTLTEKLKRFSQKAIFNWTPVIFFQLQAPYAYLSSYLSSDKGETDDDASSKLTTSESKDPVVTILTGTTGDQSAEPGCSQVDEKTTEKPTTENILTDLQK